MRVAFYAPLKSPDHPVPSGDRRLAQALVQALRASGHAVTIASRLRSFDAHGDSARQARIGSIGRRMADRLIARYRRAGDAPHVWFTYHLYHKAPDWLGPSVSAALDIPYIVAEASVAPKQDGGAWAIGYAQALHAVRAADAIVSLNPTDVEQVMRTRTRGSIMEMMPPFLDVSALDQSRGSIAPSDAAPRERVRFITVAMMRQGAKLSSYRVVAAALARLPAAAQWEIVIVGDGPARSEVERHFARFPSSRVRMTGLRSAAEIAALMHDADVFVWPAIDEAFGMVFLEAQACGLPVVGGNSVGVRAVVADGRTGLLAPLGDVDAFAAAMRRLLIDADLRAHMGRAARAYVREHHDVTQAAARLDRLLQRVTEQRGGAGIPTRPVPLRC